MAKKILTAFTEQVIQFDNEAEYADYIVSLKKGKQQFSVKDCKKDASGKVFLTVRKQYNKNVFPG